MPHGEPSAPLPGRDVPGSVSGGLVWWVPRAPCAAIARMTQFPFRDGARGPPPCCLDASTRRGTRSLQGSTIIGCECTSTRPRVPRPPSARPCRVEYCAMPMWRCRISCQPYEHNYFDLLKVRKIHADAARDRNETAERRERRARGEREESDRDTERGSSAVVSHTVARKQEQCA